MPGTKGHGGPKPKPQKILELRQSRRLYDRAEEPASPELAPRPSPPAWLEPRAKHTWHRLTKEFAIMGIVGTIDVDALARYCQLHWRYRDAEAAITAHGLLKVFMDDQGRVIGEEISRYANLSLTYADKLLRLEQQFGMTPSARAAMGVALGKHLQDAKRAAKADKARFFERA